MTKGLEVTRAVHVPGTRCLDVVYARSLELGNKRESAWKTSSWRDFCLGRKTVWKYKTWPSALMARDNEEKGSNRKGKYCYRKFLLKLAWRPTVLSNHLVTVESSKWTFKKSQGCCTKFQGEHACVRETIPVLHIFGFSQATPSDKESALVQKKWFGSWLNEDIINQAV